MHTFLHTPQGYARNEYPDEDEGEDALDEDDFDHSLSGGMYAQAAWRGGDSDGEDESSDEEQRWRPKGLRRFAFDQVCSRGVCVDNGSSVEEMRAEGLRPSALGRVRYVTEVAQCMHACGAFVARFALDRNRRGRAQAFISN